MNAKELMIGDWVYNKNIDKPIQVYPMMLSQMFRRTPGATTEDYNIYPILITPEILEKNGFENKTDIVWHDIYVLRYKIELANKELELELEQTLMLSKDPYDVFFWIPEMSAVSALNFRYVHELQHLLRMLGIEKEVEV